MCWEPYPRPNSRDEEAQPWRVLLLAAAIMLQWPEGVQICVRSGSDVNDTYAGPIRGAGGQTITGDTAGVPMLRLALSAESAAQCLICRYILDGKVNARTFKMVKKKNQSEMEIDTKDLFSRWLGPFAEREPPSS